MNMKEALVNAENYCHECSKVLKRCGEAEREDCWIYNAIKTMVRAVPEKPVVMGTIETPTGKLEKLYCPTCNRRLKNDNRNKFCPRCGKAIDWEV